ncbi:MAG: MraY family glycosyltransferase [Clostridia bacterium]
MSIQNILMITAAFICAMAVAFGATPIVKKFARAVGAIDVPKDDRRMHKKPIPRLGGLAIFFGFLFSFLIFGTIDSQMKTVLLGAVIIVILGIIDDIVPLDAKFKFIVQIIAAIIPVVGGLKIERMTNFIPFTNNPYIDFGIFSIPITILVIVGITNAVNLIDGLDGLAVGVSTISSFTMLTIAFITLQPEIAILLAALAGACVGFMPYNFNPAKIFMGDTGSTFLGYILATVSIMGLFKYYAIVSFAVPFLILGLPIFDTAFAMVRRIMHGQSPMQADRGHVHHKLIDMGFTQKQTVAILYSISGVLGLSAVVLTSSGELKALLLIITVIICAVIGMHLMRMQVNDDDDE